MVKKNESVAVTGVPEDMDQQAEYNLLASLLEAADFKSNETRIEIKRGGKFLFAFSIHPLSENDLLEARKKATSYMPNPAGKNLPAIEKETDPGKFRAWVIFMATSDEDKKKIWGDKELMKQLNVLNPVDTIDRLLTAGEKDAVRATVENISGYGSDNVSAEEFAKN